MKFRTFILFLAILISGNLKGQEGDTIQRVISWHLTEDYTSADTVAVDTAFSLFHRYRSSDDLSPFNAYPGNYGLPFYRLGFFDRSNNPDNFLKNSLLPFILTGSDTRFVNTRTPFTELKFTYGGARDDSEQTFRVIHTQNVNKDLNFGLLYDIIYSLGQYPYQRTSDKRFKLWGSYSGDIYESYLSFNINNLFFKENGGITNYDQLGTSAPGDIQVNLGGINRAGTNFRNREFLAIQKLTIGGEHTKNDSVTVPGKRLSGTLTHAFRYDVTSRTYSDENPTGGFYDSVYISPVRTMDSLSDRRIMNTLRFDVRAGGSNKFSIGFGGGIRNEIMKFGQIVPHPDSVYADTISRTRVSNVLVGRIYNNIGQGFSWNATGEFWATGYRTGDTRLLGEINKKIGKGGNPYYLKINGGFEALSPSFWFSSWGSNHFQWSGNFEKELRISAGGSISDKRSNFRLEGKYALIDNYTYFDTLALPVQHTGGLSVISVSLMKNITLWKFHLDAEGMLQQSSNNSVLSLPLISARGAIYFQHNILFPSTGGNLNTQIGAEALYHTLYSSMAYMPSTGLFYKQTSTETGNYPFINLFLNVKLKRTRFLIMFDHINAGFSGTDYMMIPGYPMNIRMFRYGLSWTFYD